MDHEPTIAKTETVMHEGRDYTLIIEDYTLPDAEDDDFSVVLRDGDVDLYAVDFLSMDDAEDIFNEIKHDLTSYV